MSGRVTIALIGAAALLAAAGPATAQEAALTVKSARASLAGEWRAELQYRDYQSDRWVGIPYTASVAMAGDGVTQVRTSAYDDGPARGTVWITHVGMLAPDGTTEYAAAFRADRPAEIGTMKLRLGTPAAGKAFDAANWVIVAETDGKDDNRPARIRETTTRAGDTVTTLKEVDFTDDAKAEWLARNRTVWRKGG